MKKLHSIPLVLTISLTALLYSPSYAQSFRIDSSFGQNGRKILTTATGNSFLYDAQKQTDGKLIAAGQISNQTTDLMLFRRNADGTPDAGFGNNGTLSWDVSGDEGLSSIALQTDGKIVGCGWQSTTSNNTAFLLTRINTNGTPDNSFGNQGTVIFTQVNGTNTSNATWRNVKIQPDGKILLVGRTFVSNEFRGLVQRYKPDGSLDSSFGTNGSVYIKYVNGSHNYGEDLFIQNDGKILVLGSSYLTAYKIHLTRLDANGVTDATFGTTGKVNPTFTGFTSALPSWLTVLSDGRIQVVGYAYNGSQQRVLCFRTTASGQMDNNFGTNGIAHFAHGTSNNYAWDAHLHTDHSLSIATEYYTGAVGSAAIVKIDSSGLLVSNYGTNGIATFSTLNDGFSSAMADDNDSLYLIGGMKGNATFFYEGFVLKAGPAGNPISTFGLASSASGTSNTFGTKMFRLPSGNVLVVGTNVNNDNDIMLAKMDKDGNLISSFGTNGTVNLNSSTYDLVKDVVSLPNGNLVFLSETGSQSLTFTSLGTFTGNQHYTLTTIDTNGQLVAGPHNATFDAAEFPKGVDIAADGNGKFVIAGRSTRPTTYKLYLARHQSNFASDAGYGNNGKINITTASNGNPVSVTSLTIAPDNKVLFVIGPSVPSVWKLNDDASGDATFAFNGAYGLTDTIGGGTTNVILTKGMNGYYLHYRKNGIVKILSLGFNGQSNTTFGTAVLGQYNEARLFEMPDTSLMVALRTDSVYTIQHVLQNGTIDNNFNASGSVVVKPFTEEHSFLDWAVAPDTSIYLYHQFKKGNQLTYIGVSKISGKPGAATSVTDVQQGLMLTVYPNPIENKFLLQFSDKNISTEALSYQLFDVTGRNCFLYVQHLSQGRVAVESTGNLPPGNYLLMGTDKKGGHFSVKLVKN
ncbi:MAG TPA: hypothetical protein VL098_07695 [Flavipsychrobacter sp.]|nr:hypothetical protein [Flavipsychrobacter sp.]